MKDQLFKRLAPRLSDPARELFEKVLEAADEVTVDEFGDLLLAFEDGQLTVRPPLRCPDENHPGHRRQWQELQSLLNANASESFRRFLEVCSAMTWGEVGDTGQIVLGHGYGTGPGGAGTLHCVGEDAMNENNFGFGYRDELFSPIDLDLQDFYIVHPDTRRLCFATEGMLKEVVDTDDPVEVYLRELCSELGIEGARHRSAWLRAV